MNVSINESQLLKAFSGVYSNIIQLCERNSHIKEIFEIEALNLLLRLKLGVPQGFSVTPNYYICAGPSGWKNFHLLVKALLHDASFTSMKEVNLASACVLFKGHSKNKSIVTTRLYRTISTCPLSSSR